MYNIWINVQFYNNNFFFIKGVYRGTDVAVKVFYNSVEGPSMPSNTNLKYTNVADTAEHFQAKKHEIDSEQRKVSVIGLFAQHGG